MLEWCKDIRSGVSLLEKVAVMCNLEKTIVAKALEQFVNPEEKRTSVVGSHYQKIGKHS
jgi:hypothetical protein